MGKIKMLVEDDDGYNAEIEVDEELLDLREHDREVREKAIDDFTHECDKYCGFYSCKNKILTRNDILKIAEQLKERKNDRE